MTKKKKSTVKKSTVKKSAVKKSSTKSSTKREVVYEVPRTTIKAGERALTAAEAKKLLGWEVEGKDKFGGDYYCSTLGKEKVRCPNAMLRQRPFAPSLARQWMGEILGEPGQGINPETSVGGNWQLTGETIVIGETGIVIEGQHRLVGLIWAAEEWAKDSKRFPGWKLEPVLNCFLVYGISEAKKVINVINTGQPRSLGDAIYACGLFSGDRKNVAKLSRIADHAVRLLWDRTGASANAFARRRTHAVSLAFLERHPKLFDCVKHIYEEDGKSNTISRYVSPGYAAALLYLAGCSSSDLKKYQAIDPRSEKVLDWGNWNKACDFFVLLSQGSKETQAVRDYLQTLAEKKQDDWRARCGILANAWNQYVEDATIVIEDIELDFAPNQDNVPTLDDCPVVGGIDVGSAKEAAEIDAEPTKEEIEKQKEKIRKGKKEGNPTKKKQKKFVLKQARRATDTWNKGDVAWVTGEEEEEPYLAKLLGKPYQCNDKKDRVLVKAQSGEWEVESDLLHLLRPGKEASASPMPQMQKQGKKKPTKKTPPKGLWRVGKLAWVVDPVGKHWRGRITKIDGDTATLRVEQGHQGAGSERSANLSQLSMFQQSE